MAISNGEQGFLDGFILAAAAAVRMPEWPRLRAGLEDGTWIQWSRSGLAEFQAIADRAQAAYAATPAPVDRGEPRAVMIEGVRVLEYSDGTLYTRTRTRDTTPPH